MKILIVEDDETVGDALALLLADEGHEVTVARDGRVALEALRRGDRPGLILLDMNMPGMSGEAFRAEQLADPGLAGIPVVPCTGVGRAGERDQTLGLTEWLRKPLDPARLVRLVNGYASREEPGVSPRTRSA